MRPATCCAVNDIVCDDREGNQCGGFHLTFQNCWKKCLEVHWCTTFSFHYTTQNCYLQSSCNKVSTTQYCTDKKDQYVIISNNFFMVLNLQFKQISIFFYNQGIREKGE